METINFQSLEKNDAVTAYDHKFVLLHSFHELQQIDTTMRLEGFIFALVKKGEVQVTIDNDIVTFMSGDIFVCNPRNILEKALFSLDAETDAFFVTPEYADYIANKVNLEWSLRILLTSHEIVHANEEEASLLGMYMDLLREILKFNDYTCKSLTIDNLFASMFYLLAGVREHNGEKLEPQNYTSAENIFQRFVKLMADKKHPYVSVNEYATELNITPKYFSAICKRLTGKTASQIIDEEVIKTAEILLHDSSLNIKQIADRLNFANQSHFGRFFTRHVGMSPQHYRESQFINNPL